MKRLASILNHDKEKIIFGGTINIDDRFISPTILKDITLDHKVMQEELFGPILPVIKYRDINDIKNI